MLFNDTEQYEIFSGLIKHKLKHISTDNTGPVAFVKKCWCLILHRRRMKGGWNKRNLSMNSSLRLLNKQ